MDCKVSEDELQSIIKFRIPIRAGVEHLKDVSVYNFNYYRLNSFDDSCHFYNDNIVEEIYYEDGDYFEYNLGHFEKGIFVTVFSWSSEYGEDSIFDKK